MRFVTSVLALAVLGAELSAVTAFPTAENLAALVSKSNEGVKKRCPYADLASQLEEATKEVNKKRSSLTPGAAPIDITGEHAFQPPNFAAGDQRGPCPGLNALANHGYLPRNGVVTLAEVVPAINQVYGMGLDIATVLGVMGTVWVGDALSLAPGFSIGGETPAVDNLLNNLGGLLGEPRGLIGSHNFIEADSSITRGDLYVTGNNYALVLDQFMQWYNMAQDGIFTMDTMADIAKLRFDQSVQTNPNFYFGPFTGAIARNAGYIFVGRFFSNYSSANPDGLLTKEIVKNFFAIYGDDDSSLTYKEGWERLPENWYRMPNDYSIVNLNLDTVGFALKYPELVSIGGNTGKVNSFTGVDVSDLTGGVLDATSLLEGNNLMCLAFEVLKTASPNFLSNIWSTLSVPLGLITNALAAPLVDLACPAFADMTLDGQPFWSALESEFPGAAKSNSSL